MKVFNCIARNATNGAFVHDYQCQHEAQGEADEHADRLANLRENRPNYVVPREVEA